MLLRLELASRYSASIYSALPIQVYHYNPVHFMKVTQEPSIQEIPGTK